MTKKKFVINKKNADNVGVVISNFKLFKNTQKNSNIPFGLVSKRMEEFFPLISNGALKLYLLYIFKSNNFTGESWHSIKGLSEILKFSERTINTLNKELIDLGLIYREANNKSNTSTFILPVDDYMFKNTTTSSIELDKNNYEKFSGKLTQVFYLFQWRKNKETGEYNIPKWNLIFVYKNKKGTTDKEIIVNKFIVEDGRIDGTQPVVNISSQDMFDDIYIIDSIKFGNDEYKEYFIDKLNMNLKGFAISSKFNLDNDEDLLNIISGISNDIEYLTTENNYKVVYILPNGS